MTRFVMVALGTALLAGCQSTLRINNDFGQAVHQDIVAQVADPDAHYAGTVAPGAGGARVELAQRRYDLNKVIPPSRAGAAQLQPGTSQATPTGGTDVTTPGTSSGANGSGGSQ